MQNLATVVVQTKNMGTTMVSTLIIVRHAVYKSRTAQKASTEPDLFDSISMSLESFLRPLWPYVCVVARAHAARQSVWSDRVRGELQGRFWCMFNAIE